MSDEHALLLGEIKAKTELTHESVKQIAADVGDVKSRLTKLETRAGTYGGIAGAVLGLGVSLLAESLKSKIGIES